MKGFMNVFSIVIEILFVVYIMYVIIYKINIY